MPRVLGSILGTKRRIGEEEEEEEKEKTFYKHLARVYLQTPSIESFTRFASINTQRPHSQKNNSHFLQKSKFQGNKNVERK
jgi:hypothetical protein